MPRASVDTPAFRAALATAGGLRGSPLPVLADRLRAAGHPCSARTLARLRARDRATPADARPDPADAVELERQAGAAVASGELGHLARVRAALVKALGEWEILIGTNPAAVRAYATLSRALGEVAEKIGALTPPAPSDPATDPACLEAQRAIVDAVAKFLARSVDASAHGGP